MAQLHLGKVLGSSGLDAQAVQALQGVQEFVGGGQFSIVTAPLT